MAAGVCSNPFRPSSWWRVAEVWSTHFLPSSYGGGSGCQVGSDETDGKKRSVGIDEAWASVRRRGGRAFVWVRRSRPSDKTAHASGAVRVVLGWRWDIGPARLAARYWPGEAGAHLFGRRKGGCVVVFRLGDVFSHRRRLFSDEKTDRSFACLCPAERARLLLLVEWRCSKVYTLLVGTDLDEVGRCKEQNIQEKRIFFSHDAFVTAGFE